MVATPIVKPSYPLESFCPTAPERIQYRPAKAWIARLQDMDLVAALPETSILQLETVVPSGWILCLGMA